VREISKAYLKREEKGVAMSSTELAGKKITEVSCIWEMARSRQC